MDDHVANLQARLQRVERRLHVMFAAWIAGIVVLAVLGVAVHQVSSAPAVLRGRALELVDAGGRVRLQLEVAPDGRSRAQFRDTAGRVRIGIGLTPSMAPQVALNDAAGHLRVELTLAGDGTPQVKLLDAKGAPVFKAP